VAEPDATQVNMESHGMNRLIVSALLLVVWLSGCPLMAEKTNAADRDRITVWDSPPPRTLLPCESQTLSEGPVCNLIFSNLIRANYAGILQPELANYWEISPDGREFTFSLRRNIRFHNGKPLTADDVIYTLKLFIKRKGANTPEVMLIQGASEYLTGRQNGVSGLTRLGDLRLRIRLLHPFKYFLQLLSHENMAVLPDNLAGMNEADFERHPVGTGPYRLRRSGETGRNGVHFVRYEFERNPDYFEPTGNIGFIDYYFSNRIVDIQTRLQFDIFSIAPGDVAGIRREGSHQAINSNFNSLDFLILNPGENPLLKDPQVRRMINYGIDRGKLAEQVLQRQGLPAHSMIPFGLLGHNPNYRLDYRQAAALRARLGGKEIAFSIVTSLRDRRPEVAAFLRDQLKTLGCFITVHVEPDLYRFLNRTIHETHSSILVGASPDYPAAFSFLSQLTQKRGIYNLFNFDWPALTEKLRVLPVLDTPSEMRMLEEIDRMFEAESIYIPLYYFSDFFAVSRRFHSFAFIFGEIIDFSRMEVSNE
jgi:ABC-type transport system substrate-binding protein